MLAAQTLPERAQEHASSTRLKAYVHLGYGFDARLYAQRYQQGLTPDPVPYGFHHAAAMDCAVTYSQDHFESWLASLNRRAWLKLLGFDLIHALRNRRALQQAQVVWTMEERQYLAVLLLKLCVPALRHLKVIAQTVWLFNRWQQISSVRRWLLTRLLRQADCLTVHSSNYLACPHLEQQGLEPQLLPFGISLDSFPLSDTAAAPGVLRRRHQSIRILAMGTDATRDWPTFLAAFGGDQRFEVIGISRSLTQEMLAGMENVSLWTDPSMEDFRACYQWADFVVVPMTPNLYSGITVALEAASMGVPIISSATGGVPTYFDPGEVLYVPPQRPEELRQAVLRCGHEQRREMVQRAQRRFKREDYSTAGMAARYVELSRRLLRSRS